MSDKKQKFRGAAVWFIALTLVIGTVLGAGIWLLNVEVPIRYDEPYRIYMSSEEIYDDWNLLPFKDTVVTETADFSHSGSGIQYHQYVRIDNPESGAHVNVMVEVTEPESFVDQMGFTLLPGIVQPGEADEEPVQEWGSITHNEIVTAGDMVEFTVIYTLDVSVPEDDGTHTITWEFREGDINENTVFNMDTDAEYLTIEEALAEAGAGHTILIGPGTYDVPDVISIPQDGITLTGTGPNEVIINRFGTGNGILVSSRDGVTLRGFTLQNAGHYGFKLQSHTSNLRIEDVHVLNSERTGVDLNRVHSAVLKDIVSEGANGGAGMSLLNSTDITVDGLRTSGNAWSGMAIYADVGDITIESSYFTNENTAIYFQYKNHTNVVIRDNTFEDLILHEDIEYEGNNYTGYVYLAQPYDEYYGFPTDFEFVVANNNFDHEVEIYGGVEDGGELIAHLILVE